LGRLCRNIYCCSGTGRGDFGVVLRYDDGDWGTIGRIKIICDPTVEGISDPVPENNPKVMRASSKHACPPLPTCGICTRSGCLWCRDTNRCECPPTTCRNFIRDPIYCPDRCTADSCETCTQSSDECAWCISIDGNGCVENGDVDQCGSVVRDPSFCPLFHQL